ncbi:DUF3618 domain-containing protein, partial [Streptomyces sp. E5N91]|uniref:DUF3618 domain-containing protein n=1 Tax=Streptomyces sp. E5N91 TaxID=1851996 RepID=UPI001EE7C231
MTDATSRDGSRSGSTEQPVGGAKGPDELRRQIEQTRGQLGDTVEELAGKADVKGRAKARAALSCTVCPVCAAELRNWTLIAPALSFRSAARALARP